MTRLRNLFIEIVVVIVIVAFGAAFFVARHDQHRYDGNAKAIASWARARGVTRVAWPQDLREAVPALLHAHVTPVLVDDRHLAPQEIAVNATPVVVTRRDTPVNLASREQLSSGPFVARRVDVDAAAQVPLEAGDEIGEDIARPYVYAPLRDSRVIAAGAPYTLHVRLDAGSYVFASEVFDPQKRAAVRLSATVDGRVLAQFGRRATGTVEGPTKLAFSIAGGGSVDVALVTATIGPPGSATFLDAWDLTRTQ
jgi:hypothetical protein